MLPGVRPGRAVARITFINTYTATAKVVTRTIAITPTCPVTKTRPAQGGDPGSCPAPKAGVTRSDSGRYTGPVRHSIIIT